LLVGCFCILGEREIFQFLVNPPILMVNLRSRCLRSNGYLLYCFLGRYSLFFGATNSL